MKSHSFKLLFFIIIAASLSSCVAEKAVTRHNSYDLHSDAKIVTPDWACEETHGSKAIPYVFGAAAAGIGYYSKFDYQGQTYDGAGSAVLAGIGGYALTYLIKSLVLSSNEERSYKPSDSREWLSNFNAQRSDNYMKVDELPTNDLVIVPEVTYHNYLKRANEMEANGELQKYYANSMQESELSPESMLFLFIIGAALIGDDSPNYDNDHMPRWKQQFIEQRILETGGLDSDDPDY